MRTCVLVCMTLDVRPRLCAYCVVVFIKVKEKLEARVGEDHAMYNAMYLRVPEGRMRETTQSCK